MSIGEWLGVMTAVAVAYPVGRYLWNVFITALTYFYRRKHGSTLDAHLRRLEQDLLSKFGTGQKSEGDGPA